MLRKQILSEVERDAGDYEMECVPNPMSSLCVTSTNKV